MVRRSGFGRVRLRVTGATLRAPISTFCWAFVAAVVVLAPLAWRSAPRTIAIDGAPLAAGPVLFTRPDCRPCRAAERWLDVDSPHGSVRVIDVTRHDVRGGLRVVPTLALVEIGGRHRLVEGASLIVRQVRGSRP